MLYSVLTASTPFLSALIHGHRLTHAAPETGLSDSCHDFSLSSLKHPNNFTERRPHIRISIPATCHYLTEYRKAVIGNVWADALVDNSKSCLYSSHVLEWKHSCDQFPENNPKAININFLGIRPMLDHLPAHPEYNTLKQPRVRGN